MTEQVKEKKYSSNKIKGEALALEYWELSDVLKVRWKDNGKKHDIDALCASIRKYGFRDAIAYDNTLQAIVEGHGRAEAVNQLFTLGEEAPRGIRVQGDKWLLPVLVGVDAKTAIEAQAYAIDHNNLVLGSDLNVTDILRLWDAEKLAPVMDRLFEQSDNAITLDAVSVQALLSTVSGEPSSDGKRKVEFEAQENQQSKIEQKFQVLISCVDEKQQTELLEKFNKEGLTCRALIS